MSMPDYTLSGGWHSPAVAAGQWGLVEQELAADPATIPPYAAFLQVLDQLENPFKPEWTLLDVGCGVGHYGSLIRKHRPQYGIRYRGTDSSLAMIAVARHREPELEFDVREFEHSEWNADVILMSLVAECSATPLALAGLALANAVASTIIWHRVRLAERSGFIEEVTYAGNRGRIWLWNMIDLVGLLNLSGRAYTFHTWPSRDDIVTVVIAPADAYTLP